MQIKRNAREIFEHKMSIFTHFFLIYAHVFAEKAVILQRDLISPIVGLYKTRNIKTQTIYEKHV